MRASDAIVAERLRRHLFGRLIEATRVLSEGSSRLAQVLIEILEIATGEAEIVGRRPLALCGHGKGSGACSCPESRQNGTVHVHGLFLVGLGKDPKEVEERGEPSILGAGSSCQ